MRCTKLALGLALCLAIPAATGWAQPPAEDTAVETQTLTPAQLWRAAQELVAGWWEAAADTAAAATTSGPSGAGQTGLSPIMEPSG